MPKLDGTGPMGQGAGTGRGMGPCGSNNQTDQNNRNGRGFGRGRFVSPEIKPDTAKEEKEISKEDK